MRPIAAMSRMLLAEAKTRDKEQSRARLPEGSHAELGDLQNAILLELDLNPPVNLLPEVLSGAEKE